MKRERSRSIELVVSGKHAGQIMLVPGRPKDPAGTYLWAGDAECLGYTKARPRQLSAFAHAILRAIGEEQAS